MRWSFARALVRTESFFGITAIVIAVASAPIFQNVGLEHRSFERYFLVMFYVSLTLSLIFLFAGRIYFEQFCPAVIKQNASLDDYLRDLPDNSTEDAQIRADMAAEWRTFDQKAANDKSIKFILYVFLTLFPLSFVLAILTLIIFAFDLGPSRSEDQPLQIHIERVEVPSEKPQAAPPSPAPSRPPHDCERKMNH